MSIPATIGEVNPQLIQQKNPNNCFGAAVEILSGVDQDEVLRTLQNAEDSQDLVDPEGRFLQPPAKMLGEALDGLVEVTEVIDPDMFDESMYDPSPDEAKKRIDTVLGALSDSGGVALWAPKIREGQDPILHAYAVTGYDAAKDAEEEDKIVVVDPSEIDGEVARFNEAEALKLATPEPNAFVPVYAYGIQPK